MKKILSFTLNIAGAFLSQDVLRSQAPVQASLQVLQQLGDQLKQQVDTSAASAIQSDHLSLSQRLAAVEQALTRQLTTLQVETKRFMTASCRSSHPVRIMKHLWIADISFPHQTGVQDYETFNDQLDSLGCWIVEAEEALRVQDPNGSTDPTVIQDRMEELKVCFSFKNEVNLLSCN